MEGKWSDKLLRSYSLKAGVNDLLLGLCLVQLLQSFVAQVTELGVGMLQLSLDLLFILLVASKHFIFLVALVPLGRAANCCHSAIKIK